jgi:predicted dehydrogenase
LVEAGKLGKISRIEQVRNGAKPYWYSRLAEVKESDVDWKEFLMDRAMRPFRADHFGGWYGVRDFSDGPIPGLASHFVDLIHYITGAKFPQSVVAQAGRFTWIDEHEFTCPDQVQAVWIYPEGFMVSYATNFANSNGNRIQMYGDHGTLDLTPWNAPKISHAGARIKGELGAETPVEPIETPDHFLDWLQCIRNRKTCRAPIEAGYQHAVAVLMAVRAHDTGKRIVYDHAKREIREG